MSSGVDGADGGVGTASSWLEESCTRPGALREISAVLIPCW